MQYLYISLAILIIIAIPHIRVICKRIILLSKLKKICELKYSFFDVFSTMRFCRGFVINGKYKVHIFTSYKRSEKIHLCPAAWQVEKQIRIIGIITRSTQKWFTSFRSYPEYIKNADENTFLLLNPAPHSIYDGDKNKIFGLNTGDKILGMEIVTMSTLIEKVKKTAQSNN